MTPTELAGQLGVHPETVRKWIRGDLLQARSLTQAERIRERARTGSAGRYCIEEDEVRRFVEWLHA